MKLKILGESVPQKDSDLQDTHIPLLNEDHLFSLASYSLHDLSPFSLSSFTIYYSCTIYYYFLLLMLWAISLNILNCFNVYIFLFVFFFYSLHHSKLVDKMSMC